MKDNTQRKRFTDEEQEEFLIMASIAEEEGQLLRPIFLELGEKYGRKPEVYQTKWMRLKQSGSEQPPESQSSPIVDAVQHLVNDNFKLKQDIQDLQEALEEANQKIAAYKPMEEEYQTLLRVINNARKSELIGESEKPKFKMDQNGNLERLG